MYSIFHVSQYLYFTLLFLSCMTIPFFLALLGSPKLLHNDLFLTQSTKQGLRYQGSASGNSWDCLCHQMSVISTKCARYLNKRHFLHINHLQLNSYKCTKQQVIAKHWRSTWAAGQQKCSISDPRSIIPSTRDNRSMRSKGA